MSKEAHVYVTVETMRDPPRWGLYGELSGGIGFESMHTMPAFLGLHENTANNLQYRAFDRSCYLAAQGPVVHPVPNWASTVSIHMFQSNKIYSIAPTLRHTVVGMENRLDYGVHTGLYRVYDGEGRAWLCGLYPGTGAGDLGWVKWDSHTDTWTSGIISGVTKPSGNRMSPCVVYEGRLAHSTNGVLTLFDPVAETVQQMAYASGSVIDRPVISDGVLYVVSGGTNRIKVHGLRFGALSEQADLGPHAINIGGGGDFALFRFGPGPIDLTSFFVMWYTTTGGQGSRCSKVETSSGLAVVGTRDLMPPVAVPSVLPAPDENMRWPVGSAHPTYSYESAFDNVDFPPTTTPGSGPAGHLKVIRSNKFPPINLAPSAGRGLTVSFNFQGELAAMTALSHSVTLSQDHVGHNAGSSSSFLGGDDTRNNVAREKWWVMSAVPVSVPGVPRGVLITFAGTRNGQGYAGWPNGNVRTAVQFYFGRKGQRPNQVATLVAGAASFPEIDVNVGGAPNFQPSNIGFLNPVLNRVQNCIADADGSFVHVTWGPCFDILAAPDSLGMDPTFRYSGNLGPNLGTYIEIQTHGVDGSGEGVLDTFGVGIVFGQSIWEIDPINFQDPHATIQAVTPLRYQVIWDLDADSVPDDEFVTIAPYSFNIGGIYAIANPGIFDDDVMRSGAAAGFLTGTALRLTSDYNANVVESLVETQSQTEVSTEGPTTAPLTTSQTATASSLGPTVETFVETDADTTERQGEGPAVEVTPNTLLTPQDILRPRGSEPVEQGGGAIAWLADGVELSARNVANVANSGAVGHSMRLAPNAVPDLTLEWDGWVLLGMVTIDAVNDAPGTVYNLLDMDAAGLVQAGVLAVEITSVNLTGMANEFTDSPLISIGSNASRDDQMASTNNVYNTAVGDSWDALRFVGPGIVPRPVLKPGDLLQAQLDAVALATSYVVEVRVFGFSRIP